MTGPVEAVEAVEAAIDAGLRARADPQRARAEKAYLKSDLEHHGVTVPGIRATVRAAARDHPGLSHDQVVELAGRLWSEPVHERRMAAVEVLVLHAALLGPPDLTLLERLLRESRTWALVDGLAASVVGAVVERHPDHPEVGAALDRWAGDPDFWLRRAALLALLPGLRGGAGDFDRFSRYADAMLGEREFFVRKAIGWVLRDTAKQRPALVHDWLLPRAGRASGVTFREAVKPLAEDQRAALLAARG